MHHTESIARMTGASRHHPALPPPHPAFRTIIASIPRAVEKFGAYWAARMCRRAAEQVDNAIVAAGCGNKKLLAAMERDGITVFDLNELSLFLHARAAELSEAH